MFKAKDYNEMAVIAGEDEGRNAIMNDLMNFGSNIEFDDFINSPRDNMILICNDAERKGIERGALQNRIEMIKEMHNNGIDDETISKVAYMSIEDVQDILNS